MKSKLKLIINHSVVKNGIWLLVLQGFNTILPFITVPYITRILEASSYGDFSLGLNWIGYLQIIVEYGFIFSGTKKLALLSENGDIQEQNKLYSKIILARIYLCIFTGALLIVLLLVLKFTFRVKLCMCILFLMVIGVVFQHTWFFQGKEDMKYITFGNALGRSITTALIFLCVKKPDDIYLYCFLYSFNFILMALFGLYLARKKFNARIVKCSFNEVVDELRDGWYLFISSAMTKVFSGFGVTFLGFFVSTKLIGIYSAIYKIPYLFLLLWNPISQALYPYCSKKYAISFYSGFNTVKKISFTFVISFSLIGSLIIIFNNSIVSIVFGKEYADYSYILIPLIIWILIGIANNFLGIQTLVASGNEKNYSKVFSINMIFSIILTILLGYNYTIFGISLSMAISEFILFLMLINEVRSLEKKESMHE